MGLSGDDVKKYWLYFRSLANQFQKTEQYVDHSLNSDGKPINADTFSNEFAKILMLAASEFEVVAKDLCVEIGATIRSNAKITTISKEILKVFPKIGDTVIMTPYQTIRPLKDWQVVVSEKTKKDGTTQQEETVEGIPWWQSHNSVKHNRRVSFLEANLSCCMSAMASLMVLELYLCWKVDSSLGRISSLGCDYFTCEYFAAYRVTEGGNVLPDSQPKN
jgi:hypothetical protein